ncbi:MAG: thioether cross-link-forming SCIFF peptide maturase [Ruminococcus sp.]|nr:thioether cross-link-forming SCIFF peptide maturase [Ruminococcus sp.]
MMSKSLIHSYKLGGKNIILDVNSGSVHEADELTYDLLAGITPPFLPELDEDILNRLTRFYTKEEIIECYDEIKELYKEDLLYSSDIYGDYAAKSVPSPIKAMCLLIAEDCNLRCEYCFAEGGDYGKGARKLMPLVTAKAALDFLVSHSYGRENLEVDFFGGEPLLNWEVVKETVRYGRELEKTYKKNIRFTITTNGILLDDEKIDFINAEMSNVVLSLDGRKAVHDRMRVYEDGSGSYDEIIGKFKELVKRRGDKDYYVRGTFTKHNLDFADDVLAIYNEGFTQISVEPVIADKNLSNCDYAITEKELPAIFKEYERLAKIIINNHRSDEPRLNFFHFSVDLWNGPCIIKRMRGCGCGNEYCAVSPDGNIYPCHQFSGVEKYLMGNISQNNFNFEIKNEFASANVMTKPDCSDCWAKYFCSGGCDANNFNFTGDIKTPVKLYCELQKKRLECAIAIQSAEYNAKSAED